MVFFPDKHICTRQRILGKQASAYRLIPQSLWTSDFIHYKTIGGKASQHAKGKMSSSPARECLVDVQRESISDLP